MTHALFWTIYGLVAFFAVGFMTVRGVRSTFAVIFLFLLSLGGLFLLFNNIFLGVVYLLTILIILFLVYSYVDVIDVKDQSPFLKPTRFFNSVISVTFTIYLFFVLFTALFAGEEHLLGISEGYGLSWLNGSRLAGKFTHLLILIIIAFLISSLGAISFAKEDN